MWINTKKYGGKINFFVLSVCAVIVQDVNGCNSNINGYGVMHMKMLAIATATYKKDYFIKAEKKLRCVPEHEQGLMIFNNSNAIASGSKM